MGLFDINISQLVKDLLPSKHRTTEKLKQNEGLLSGLGRNARILKDYKEGASASTYSAGTYGKYDQVIYNQAVYESLIDSNTDAPDIVKSWVKIIDVFLPSNETQYYDANKISLEYALNKYFGLTFNSPPTLSDIYITNNVNPTPSFVCGLIESQSSAVGVDTSEQYVPLTYTTTTLLPSFSINVPTAFYVSLGADAEQIIRNFADKYVATSLTYNINQY
jgi:hypothetical protein